MTYSAAPAIDVSTWDATSSDVRDFARRPLAPARRQAPLREAPRRQASAGILSDVFAGGVITSAAWLTAGALAVAAAWTIATTLNGNPFNDDAAPATIEAPAPAPAK